MVKQLARGHTDHKEPGYTQVCLGLESKLLTTMLVSIKGNVPKAVVSVASVV